MNTFIKCMVGIAVALYFTAAVLLTLAEPEEGNFASFIWNAAGLAMLAIGALALQYYDKKEKR